MRSVRGRQSAHIRTRAEEPGPDVHVRFPCASEVAHAKERAPIRLDDGVLRSAGQDAHVAPFEDAIPQALEMREGGPRAHADIHGEAGERPEEADLHSLRDVLTDGELLAR